MSLINVSDLFLDNVHNDVIFVVEGKEIPGHRVVLAKSCPYFDKLLFGDFLESKSKKVDISGPSAKVFQEVIRFIYKGQLEVNKWTIKELMALLAVSHEYQLQTLFSAVIKALEGQPLDFGSWPLVNSAASVYDSEELKNKSAAFAEDKIDDFIHEIDLANFSAEFICCMFDCPKMSSFKADHFVKAICNWKRGQSSSNIMSVMQKINWNEVSPEISAVIVEEFFSTVKNIEHCKIWTKLSSIIQGPLKGKAPNECILRVDSVVLSQNKEVKFAMAKNKGNVLGRLDKDYLVFRFIKDGSWFDIPVKGIEFEASTQLIIESISGFDLAFLTRNMDVSKPTSNNGWFKYSGVVSDAQPVYAVRIKYQDFVYMPKISLRNIIIW